MALKIIAHRGGAKETLENTLAGFQYAISIGACFVEFDVRFTKDYQVIVHHDSSTKKFWNKNYEIAKSSLSDLKQLVSKKNEFQHQKIPTLKEVLSICRSKIGMMIELKADEVFLKKKFVETVLHDLLILSSSHRKNVYLASFDIEILKEVKKQDKSQKITYITDQKKSIEEVYDLEPAIFAMHYSLISKKLARKMHAQGIRIWIWTVNDVIQAKGYTAMNIDGIITDSPLSMQKLI